MKLRTRLVLSLAVIAVPLVLGAQWMRADFERRSAVSNVAAVARARMESGGREKCESSPATFQDPPRGRGPGDRPGGDHGPGERGPPDHEHGPGERERHEPGAPRGRGPGMAPRLEMFAYSPDFSSANPAAPVFPADVRARLEAGAREAGYLRVSGDRCDVLAGVRMAWDSGPCAILLVTRREDELPGGWLQGAEYGAMIVGGLLLAGYFAVGPVERRIRRLTQGVRHSAGEHYRGTVPVEGKDEVGELAQAFNAASAEVRLRIEELQQRERTLRDFVQNTTHDVMLPLTVLQGHLLELRDTLARGEPATRGQAESALEESHYLVSLVQNLATAAQLEAGRPEPQRDPFSWNQVVERVVMRHRPIARQKQVDLDFVGPPEDVRAEGDVTLVEQALSNVVHNAVRYGRRGGHVVILLECAEGRFSLRVLDDGPGVDPEDMARLVERSYRSDAARMRQPDGRGLGLSIAKEIADLHGFTFAIRRSDAGGLEVELAGPVLAESPPAHAPLDEQMEEGTRSPPPGTGPRSRTCQADS